MLLGEGGGCEKEMKWQVLLSRLCVHVTIQERAVTLKGKIFAMIALNRVGTNFPRQIIITRFNPELDGEHMNKRVVLYHACIS